MRRLTTVLAAVLMLTVLAACGDDDAGTITPEATTATTAGGGDTATTAGTSDDTTDGDGGSDTMMGDSYADVTVDGTTIRFSAADTTFSTVEGVQDMTFEECDSNFFGAGFWVIAYPVDGDGAIVLADDGTNIAGIMTAVFPFDDTPPDMMEFEFDVEFEPLGLDARFRAEDGGAFAYEIDGNRVTGNATLDQFGETVDITFDIVCAG